MNMTPFDIISLITHLRLYEVTVKLFTLLKLIKEKLLFVKNELNSNVIIFIVYLPIYS